MKKILILAVGLIAFLFNAHAQNCQLQKQLFNQLQNSNSQKLMPTAGDSIHVVHYDITIDSIINNSVKAIYANTKLKVKARVNNVNVISLSLLKLTIDSVTSNSVLLSYAYNDTTISIYAPNTLNINDSIELTVYYHGKPLTDASGWGGFYFSAGYVFNLGVGFAADPHTFGRAWFPCVDEFTDKATYDFYIATEPTKKAFCNGILIDSSLQANTNNLIWHWKMNQPIPTYLACMAVSSYYTLEQNINGIKAQFATSILDTTKVKNTFVHLPDIMTTYINSFGPYPFDKIGFSMVPFGSGAMEHASQITIGSAFIDGSLTYESLWAHELSHMWWGDKVTCETAGDMWLNEGWASFNEAYTREFLYGKQSYKNYVSANHKTVLQFAHVDDGGYLSFINVPHAYTYGSTVYKKGADAAHTLRNFLGDSLFKIGMQYYMNNRAYGNANSYQFRDDIITSTGVDVTRFFDDWIFTEGFPHFSIDSVVFVPGGLDHYFVYTRQRSKGNNHLYSMPVDITLSNGTTDTTYTIVIDSTTQMFHIATLGVFDWFALDRSEKMSDAITDDEITVNAAAITNLPETFTSINSIAVPVSGSLVRVEHNWVAPDGFKNSNPGIRLSNYRYWTINGHFKPGYHAKATFTYDGRTIANTGHLDNTLGIIIEDSLVLVYRNGSGDDWKIIPQTTNFNGSHVDRFGTITIDSLMRGEYALGYYDYTVGVPSIAQAAKTYTLTVSPNPTNKICNIAFTLNNLKQATIAITNMLGAVVKVYTVYAHQEQVSWDAADMPAGTYNICLTSGDKILNSEKLILTK